MYCHCYLSAWLQQVYIFGGQNDYNMMLQLTTKHVFEIFIEGNCSLAPTPVADLRQRHNVAFWLLYMPHLALGATDE